MQDYKVQLESYSGPLDLLLYLIRRDEIDVYDIPISRVLEQYLEYVRLLEELDPDTAGEFLVMAATLMEIKSRLLLPKPPPESQEADDWLDPRADLVRQLLAYRSFRDAAEGLNRMAAIRSQRFGRKPPDLADEENQVDLEDLQIWDLMAVFNKLLAAIGKGRAQHEVLYDDTPITLHAADILDRLEREGRSMHFERIFEGRSRSEMIGLFLALLELIRQDRVRVEQTEQFGSINVHLIDATPITTVMASADRAAFKEANEAPAVEPLEEPVGEDEPEPVFAEEEDEEEADEFSRKISAIEVGDVDLGKGLERQPDGEVGSDE
ncbi:MAG TPA: segregation/condensation protein A [Phycisphaerae bacterium]|jgi:segregation and condensation protein A|nr:segregation/condensation protein A [Phycisphaerae bacterium]HOB75153.1 segregation/condensation protein A [Phycisphaerae bacterium]HOJ54625.1 segregation/condensation protein A [Phycisphaerae bacterium]HOL27251.1 segregation/condensation protein A [Phycisphaerae bacterium]HPP21051.1 segregation/condensation protein A [Phycisphaerae bacterium]